MAITLKGIRLDSVNLVRDNEVGAIKLNSASYSLISSADLVLASQGIGGYNDKVKVEPSATTVKALNDFIASYKQDISMVLGLDSN